MPYNVPCDSTGTVPAWACWRRGSGALCSHPSGTRVHGRKLGLEVASVVDANVGTYPGLRPSSKFKVGTVLCLPGEVGLRVRAQCVGTGAMRALEHGEACARALVSARRTRHVLTI